MATTIGSAARRAVLAGLVALLVAGGLGLGGRGAAALTRVLRSDDGKLVLVCHYDDRTGELAFCDVYWFPLTAEGGGRGTMTQVGAGDLTTKGNLVAVAPGVVGGAPQNVALSAAPASGAAAAALQAIKHPGKGKGSGHGKHGKAGRT